MKVINIGSRYEIYSDDLVTCDCLPAKTYMVGFSPRQGFWLDEYNEFEIKENKIYGVHEEKINKVLKSFSIFNRNLGVILSGNKGIGKSLFAKLLSKNAIKQGIPVIIVDTYYPGIASYLQEIEQEVVVLFDEFDKTFGGIKPRDGEADPQTELLTLFDGLSTGKKLFVITCNELRNLNSFLVNRPGRFHYHFRFEYPSGDEIREYLMDNLDKKYYGEINEVVSFSKKIDLNYDCLRAIVFELNLGEKFKDCIKDLNIVNTERFNYQLLLYAKDGTLFKSGSVCLNLFNYEEPIYCWLSDKNNRDSVQVNFNAADLNYNGNFFSVKGEDITIEYDCDYEEDYLDSIKKLEWDYLKIVKVKDNDLHYSV